MYIDRKNIETYPYIGSFYEYRVDISKPLDEREEEEILVLATKCDIQESNKALSGGITANYAVFFPFDKSEVFPIKNGMTFKGDMYGLRVNGLVRSIIPTQMGGCVAYITDKDV